MAIESIHLNVFKAFIIYSQIANYHYHQILYLVYGTNQDSFFW